ncbi:MAG: tRNA CCA-pyrophosphorylase [Candidatus Thorarchaeota archaeon]|nr:tRNA CCA-pyrophosphorylase [Candidatus Thorarchaeota archaeon]
MTAKSVKVLLTSGRTLSQGRTMEKGKITPEYGEAVAICELDGTAMEYLGINEGEAVIVKTKFGKAVVHAKLNKSLHPGVAFIPCGPYFNLLIDSNTQYTGMPGYKSLEASVSAGAGARVLSVEDLIEKMKEGN